MSKTPRTDAWTWNKEGYDTPMEDAGDILAEHHLLLVKTREEAKDHVAEWLTAMEAKP